MKKYILALAMLGMAGVTEAQSWGTELKEGFAICLSEELFNEMMQGVANNDRTQIGYLLTNGCFVTQNGVKFSLIDLSLKGVAKIRAYSNKNESAVFWTDSRAIALK